MVCFHVKFNEQKWKVFHVFRVFFSGSWMYEYGCSRYKTIMYWNFGFTFMEIPEELNGKIDPTQAIVYELKYTAQNVKAKFHSSFIIFFV